MKEEENVYAENDKTEEVATAKDEKEQTKEASTVLGKFKDVDALARAYSALQAEFTRRSQRLKELERAAENFNAEGQAAADPGVEKLRRNAQARREAAKKFDAFMAEVGKVRTDGGQALRPAEDIPLKEEVAEGNNAEEPLKSEQVSLPRAESAESTKGAEEERLPVAKSGEALSLADDLYAQVSRNEGVRLKIIGEYLASIGKSGAPITTGRAGTLASPPLKARSIGDAGDMALQYFKKKPVES